MGSGCAATLVVFILATLSMSQVEGFKWIVMGPTSNLPNDCDYGGYEKSANYDGKLYIARKQIGNELVIGKVIFPWRSAYFGKDGQEIWSDTYDIFCGVNDQGSYWVTPDGLDFKNVVAGGRAGDGTTFYICRGHIDGNSIPGKFYRPTGCCYVPSNGQEICAKDIGVLVTG